jgi:hypothetical protein
MIKSRRIRWAGYVTSTKDKEYRVLVVETEGKNHYEYLQTQVGG